MNLLCVWISRVCVCSAPEVQALLPGKATIASGLRPGRVEELETLSSNTKPRTSHRRSPGAEGDILNRINIGETYERQGTVQMGLLRSLRLHLRTLGQGNYIIDKNRTTQTQDSRLSHFLLLWTPHLEITPTRPLDIAQLPCHLLQTKLKTFLFSQYYRPSYVPQSSEQNDSLTCPLLISMSHNHRNRMFH